jgi:hypothetical protein
MIDPIATAPDLAHELLKQLPERLAHTEAVAHKAAARQRSFDVLLVGYVSRWQRNLRRTLELLEDVLHPAGVAVYFCDEEILSSSDRHWDQDLLARLLELNLARARGGNGASG